MEKRSLITFIISIVLIFATCCFEKFTRFEMSDTLFSTEHHSVKYRWASGVPWDSTLADPANIGSHSKWLGLAKYDWYIEIPSYKESSRNEIVPYDSISYVSPVKGETYECKNGIFQVECTGRFRYQLQRGKVTFMYGGRLIDPPGSWLEDTREGKLVVYKYF